MQGFSIEQSFYKGLFMKKWLQEKLVCPECTMDAKPLDLEIKEERDDDDDRDDDDR